MNLLRRTLAIEADGGMLTFTEPRRRRTIGGVFFRLCDKRAAKRVKQPPKQPPPTVEQVAETLRAKSEPPAPRPPSRPPEVEVIIKRPTVRPPAALVNTEPRKREAPRFADLREGISEATRRYR